MRIQFLTGLFLAVFSLNADEPCSLEHGIMGIYAVRCSTGEILLNQNSDLSLNPASCMKIATSAAALKVLGCDYRFETHLAYDGKIQDRILQGNLYIVGGGDPMLGSGRSENVLTLEKQIQVWADAVQKLGISAIRGKVIGDASQWESALAVPSWSWEDLGNYYGAGASALSFHENAYSLVFKPGAQVGERAEILRTEPKGIDIELKNEVKTGPAGSGDRACIFGSELSHLQIVRGTIPAMVEEFAIRGAIPDPASFCASLLKKELETRGILIENKALSSLPERTDFYTTFSPPLSEIIYWMNQKSINLYAEHLLKQLGGGFTSDGIRVIREALSSMDIDLKGFSMADGSGLSRKNLATAKQFVSLLAKLKNSGDFPILLHSLPEKGEWIRAKSGSMSLIRCYVGYAGDIAFAVFINNCPDPPLIRETMNTLFSQLDHIAKTDAALKKS